jgi:hypothetical protein
MSRSWACNRECLVDCFQTTIILTASTVAGLTQSTCLWTMVSSCASTVLQVSTRWTTQQRSPSSKVSSHTVSTVYRCVSSSTGVTEKLWSSLKDMIWLKCPVRKGTIPSQPSTTDNSYSGPWTSQKTKIIEWAVVREALLPLVSTKADRLHTVIASRQSRWKRIQNSIVSTLYS